MEAWKLIINNPGPDANTTTRRSTGTWKLFVNNPGPDSRDGSNKARDMTDKNKQEIKQEEARLESQ